MLTVERNVIPRRDFCRTLRGASDVDERLCACAHVCVRVVSTCTHHIIPICVVNKNKLTCDKMWTARNRSIWRILGEAYVQQLKYPGDMVMVTCTGHPDVFDDWIENLTMKLNVRASIPNWTRSGIQITDTNVFLGTWMLNCICSSFVYFGGYVNICLMTYAVSICMYINFGFLSKIIYYVGISLSGTNFIPAIPPA